MYGMDMDDVVDVDGVNEVAGIGKVDRRCSKCCRK